MKVEVYKKDRIIKTYRITEIAHFGVVRDYTLTSDCGVEIEISADIIEKIVEHENKESSPHRR